jgi:hypothetical protein
MVELSAARAAERGCHSIVSGAKPPLAPKYGVVGGLTLQETINVVKAVNLWFHAHYLGTRNETAADRVSLSVSLVVVGSIIHPIGLQVVELGIYGLGD